jgi:hypothetical protein
MSPATAILYGMAEWKAQPELNRRPFVDVVAGVKEAESKEFWVRQLLVRTQRPGRGSLCVWTDNRIRRAAANPRRVATRARSRVGGRSCRGASCAALCGSGRGTLSVGSRAGDGGQLQASDKQIPVRVGSMGLAAFHRAECAIQAEQLSPEPTAEVPLVLTESVKRSRQRPSQFRTHRRFRC